MNKINKSNSFRESMSYFFSHCPRISQQASNMLVVMYRLPMFSIFPDKALRGPSCP